MHIEFVTYGLPNDVVGSLDMPMPPRSGETVLLGDFGNEKRYVVGWSEYQKQDGETVAISTVRAR